MDTESLILASQGDICTSVKMSTPSNRQCFSPVLFEQGQMLRQYTAGSIGPSNFTELKKANIWEFCLKYLSGS